MNKLEKLKQEAFEDKVKVHDYYLGEESLKGLYIDGNVAINTSVNNSAGTLVGIQQADRTDRYYTDLCRLPKQS